MATYNFDATTIQTKEGQRSVLSKSFFYMFIMLIATVVVCVATSLIFRACGLSVEPGVKVPVSTAQAYFITMLTAGITQIILTIVIFISCIRPGKVAIVPMALYTVCMGILLSSFSIFLNWWTLASTFAIAALAFGGMALIGLRSKHAGAMGMIGFGLLFSVLLVSLFSVFLVLFAPNAFLVTNIVTSVVVVIAIMLITTYDVYSIKRISAYYSYDERSKTNDLSLFFAFSLYLDFIMILVRVLQLVAVFGNNRN